MSCNCNCKICDKIIISRSVSVLTIGGVNTLVIDIPAGSYVNCCKYCLVVAQQVPNTATINMPVAISINGNTATTYRFVGKCCRQLTACGIVARTKYPVIVTTTATGGEFVCLRNVQCYPREVLQSLPVQTANEIETVKTTKKEAEK